MNNDLCNYRAEREIIDGDVVIRAMNEFEATADDAARVLENLLGYDCDDIRYYLAKRYGGPGDVGYIYGYTAERDLGSIAEHLAEKLGVKEFAPVDFFDIPVEKVYALMCAMLEYDYDTSVADAIISEKWGITPRDILKM